LETHFLVKERRAFREKAWMTASREKGVERGQNYVEKRQKGDRYTASCTHYLTRKGMNKWGITNGFGEWTAAPMTD